MSQTCLLPRNLSGIASETLSRVHLVHFVDGLDLSVAAE